MLVPVFLNGNAVQVDAGTTLGALLATHAPDLYNGLLTGKAVATDARSLPVSPDSPVFAGAIFQVRMSARDIADATHA